jgi:hypothetical protein
MSDPASGNDSVFRGPPSDRVESRLTSAFNEEMAAAAEDLANAPGAGSLANTSSMRLSPRVALSGAGNPSRRTQPLQIGAVAVVALLASASILVAAFVRSPTAPSAGASVTGSSGPQISPAVSLDALRYEDGIPRTFDDQLVLRWGDALALRLTAKDDSPFLVGAWLDVITGPMWCPPMPADRSAPNSWASNVCSPETVSAEAGGPYGIAKEASFRFIEKDPSTGPAILRVHVHDPRASDCGTQRALCDSMLVVESVVWSGDSYTDPKPLTVADVIAAANSVQPSTSLVIAGPTSPYYDERLDGALRLTSSNLAQTPPSDMQIAGAYLMPSVEAMQRALPSVQPGAAGALLPTAYRTAAEGGGPGYSYSLVYRWLVVDNVALSVEMLPDASAADRAWLGSLEAALEARR